MQTLEQQFKIVNEILDNKETKIYYHEGEREIVDNFFRNFIDLTFLKNYESLWHSALNITNDAKEVILINKAFAPRIHEKIKKTYRKLLLKFRIRGYEPLKEKTDKKKYSESEEDLKLSEGETFKDSFPNSNSVDDCNVDKSENNSSMSIKAKKKRKRKKKKKLEKKSSENNINDAEKNEENDEKKSIKQDSESEIKQKIQNEVINEIDSLKLEEMNPDKDKSEIKIDSFCFGILSQKENNNNSYIDNELKNSILSLQKTIEKSKEENMNELKNIISPLIRLVDSLKNEVEDLKNEVQKIQKLKSEKE